MNQFLIINIYVSTYIHTYIRTLLVLFLWRTLILLFRPRDVTASHYCQPLSASTLLVGSFSPAHTSVNSPFYKVSQNPSWVCHLSPARRLPEAVFQNYLLVYYTSWDDTGVHIPWAQRYLNTHFQNCQPPNTPTHGSRFAQQWPISLTQEKAWRHLENEEFVELIYYKGVLQYGSAAEATDV